MSNTMHNTSDDPQNINGILGPLPISRVLFLQSLKPKAVDNLQLIMIILEQLSDKARADEVRRNKERSEKIVSIDKEFGADSQTEEPDKFEDVFLPYQTPLFSLNAIKDALQTIIRSLDVLEGFLAQCGVTISEVAEMEPADLIAKVQAYVNRSNDTF